LEPATCEHQANRAYEALRDGGPWPVCTVDGGAMACGSTFACRSIGETNDGFALMRAGEVARGVILFD